jgi:hypothetical protein
MIPKIVKIFKVLVNAKANNAPMNESGMEKSTTNGCANCHKALPLQDILKQ